MRGGPLGQPASRGRGGVVQRRGPKRLEFIETISETTNAGRERLPLVQPGVEREDADFVFTVAKPALYPIVLLFGALWAASPALARAASLPPRSFEHEAIAIEDERVLRSVARRSWRYFEAFVGPEDNHLPPDNVQEDPHLVAYRTSPTNVGLSLLSTVAAHDLGGGELRVHTDLADAVVHGTRFRVTRDEDGFLLVVEEGLVGVERRGHEVARVGGGERWSMAIPTVTASAIEAPQPARPSGHALLGEARALKTRGELDAARDRYRRAGAAGQGAAWLELAMLETNAGRWADARDAFAELRRRGGATDPLLAEAAASAELRMERRAGNGSRARTLAEEIVRRWPESAAASEARRVLGGGAQR